MTLIPPEKIKPAEVRDVDGAVQMPESPSPLNPELHLSGSFVAL